MLTRSRSGRTNLASPAVRTPNSSLGWRAFQRKCFSVGEYFNSKQVAVNEVLRWNGRNWALHNPAVYDNLNGFACIPARACLPATTHISCAGTRQTLFGATARLGLPSGWRQSSVRRESRAIWARGDRA